MSEDGSVHQKLACSIAHQRDFLHAGHIFNCLRKVLDRAAQFQHDLYRFLKLAGKVGRTVGSHNLPFVDYDHPLAKLGYLG